MFCLFLQPPIYITINSELLAIILIPQSVNERLYFFVNLSLNPLFNHSINPLFLSFPQNGGAKLITLFLFSKYFLIFFELFLSTLHKSLSIKHLMQKTGRKYTPFFIITQVFLLKTLCLKIEEPDFFLKND